MKNLPAIVLCFVLCACSEPINGPARPGDLGVVVAPHAGYPAPGIIYELPKRKGVEWWHVSAGFREEYVKLFPIFATQLGDLPDTVDTGWQLTGELACSQEVVQAMSELRRAAHPTVRRPLTKADLLN